VLSQATRCYSQRYSTRVKRPVLSSGLAISRGQGATKFKSSKVLLGQGHAQTYTDRGPPGKKAFL